jgi:hypothetical protein
MIANHHRPEMTKGAARGLNNKHKGEAEYADDSFTQLIDLA